MHQRDALKLLLFVASRQSVPAPWIQVTFVFHIIQQAKDANAAAQLQRGKPLFAPYLIMNISSVCFEHSPFVLQESSSIWITLTECAASSAACRSTRTAHKLGSSVFPPTLFCVGLCILSICLPSCFPIQISSNLTYPIYLSVLSQSIYLSRYFGMLNLSN